MMINNYKIAKLFLTMLALTGTILLVSGIILKIKGIIICGVIVTIAVALFSVGFVMSMRTRTTIPQMGQNISLNNPLLSVDAL